VPALKISFLITSHPSKVGCVVALTGATGFVGRHLAKTLLEARLQVVALGRRDPNIPDVTFRRCADLAKMTTPEDWAAYLSGVDYVVHLAAITPHQPDRPPTAKMFMQINANATAALTEAARDAGVHRLVFISSIGAVTTFSDTPITPSSPCKPKSDYGRSKYAAERAIARLLGPGSSMDYCILRPNLVYGPDNPGNMTRLLMILEKGLPLPFASFKNRRSFLYIGNLCTLILRALDHDAVSRQALPVADPEPLSTPQLLRLIGTTIGRPARLYPCPIWLLYGIARVIDGVLRFAGKSPKGLPALERLTSSLSTNMGPTLASFGEPNLLKTEEGITRSFGPTSRS